MTDFNFLRIKWPKLAAIAADAGRLVEVSPASAISTMQNFCEWAADIALDFYDIETQNGITYQEKLDTLKTAGNVPPDVLNRFHNIMMAGGRHLYRANEDVEEARQCLDDVYEIGRWLNKEADRSGWPPKNEYYRPVMGLQGDSSSTGFGGFVASRVGKGLSAYKSLILMVGGTLVVIVATIFIVKGLISANADARATPPQLTPTTSVFSTPLTATPEATPTPPAEVVDFLDSLTPKSNKPNTFFLKQWDFQSGAHKFAIGDTQYEHGLGMYIPKKSISKTQGTMSISFDLGGKYSKLRFDLGVDSKLQYEDGYGKFRVMIYCDSTNNDAVYDSGMKEYTFTDPKREIEISGCQRLIIRLTEIKGNKGTINVVLGDIRLVQSAGAPTDTSEPEGTATEGATATATEPGGTQRPGDTNKPTATQPEETVNNSGEQEQPPG